VQRIVITRFALVKVEFLIISVIDMWGWMHEMAVALRVHDTSFLALRVSIATFEADSSEKYSPQVTI